VCILDTMEQTHWQIIANTGCRLQRDEHGSLGGVSFVGATDTHTSVVQLVCSFSVVLNCMPCPCVSGVTLGLVRNSEFSNILDLRIGV
jgi:hypothetical protein